MREIHETARAGFTAEAESYDRGRPGYPPAAISLLMAMLGIDETTTVVDIGAGTGKFTGQIAAFTRVVAVEPVGAMHAILHRRFPDVSIVEGSAEAIPLLDGYADVVTVAQAFHWFDGNAALQEMHRVLRPRGRLGLVWNVRDETSQWVRELMDLIRPYQGGTPVYTSGAWKRAFEHQPFFRIVAHKQVKHAQSCTISEIIDHMASISYVAALEASIRKELLERISSHLISWHRAGRVEFPYRTDLWAYLRL
jgi:SAM-dependent methyltransferase